MFRSFNKSIRADVVWILRTSCKPLAIWTIRHRVPRCFINGVVETVGRFEFLLDILPVCIGRKVDCACENTNHRVEETPNSTFSRLTGASSLVPGTELLNENRPYA